MALLTKSHQQVVLPSLTQVKSDTLASTITNYVWNCVPKNEAHNLGKITNVQRMENMVAFEVRVWNTAKRNQVLRAPRVSGFIKVFPAYPPPGQFDHTALMLHRQGNPVESEQVIDLVNNQLEIYPRPECVAQIYDTATDKYNQSWFLGFEDASMASYYLEVAKPKLAIMNGPSGSYNISKCKGSAPPKADKPKQKRNGTEGRGGRSVRARGRK